MATEEGVITPLSSVACRNTSFFSEKNYLSMWGDIAGFLGFAENQSFKLDDLYILGPRFNNNSACDTQFGVTEKCHKYEKCILAAQRGITEELNISADLEDLTEIHKTLREAKVCKTYMVHANCCKRNDTPNQICETTDDRTRYAQVIIFGTLDEVTKLGNELMTDFKTTEKIEGIGIINVKKLLNIINGNQSNPSSSCSTSSSHSESHTT